MKLYSTKEMAELLHVSIRTLKYWRKSGKLIPEVKGAKGAKFYSEVQLLEVQKFLKGAKNFTAKLQGCKNLGVQELKNCTGAKTEKEKKNMSEKNKTPNTDGAGTNYNADFSTNTAQNQAFAQELKNLPLELLTQPRFFPVNEDKTPKDSTVQDTAKPMIIACLTSTTFLTTTAILLQTRLTKFLKKRTA